MADEEFSLIGMLIKIFFGFIIYGALFFLPAGRIDWLEAWIFLLLSFSYVLVVVFYFWRRDPTIIISRTKVKPEKGFDTIFLIITGFCFLMMFLLAASDFRSGISEDVFWEIKAFGFLLVVITYIIVFIVMKENAFASKAISVQEGQQVISTGPYAVVRHPMYSGFLFMFIGFPLSFGSFVSIPFGLFSLLMLAIRSVYEERSLIEDLPGYKEYTQKVRYRFIPKIW